MRKVTLIRGARQLLTLRGPTGPRRGADLQHLGIIPDGALLIAGGRIVEVGPSRRIENLALARGAQEVDASGCVVMPGFVDCNVHLVTNVQERSPRALTFLALHAVEEAIRCGTTAMEAKSESGLTAPSAMKVLRVHAALRDLPFSFVSTAVAPQEPLLAMPRARRLADFLELPSENGETLAKALEFGWSVKPGDSGAIKTLTPLVSFLADSSFAPARAMIENGAAVALASGAAPANMQTMIALACRAMEMTSAEAISAATINGAHAMRRAASIGSIEVGKSADVLILGLPDYRELPYHLGVNLANVVIIQGSVRVERSSVMWPDHEWSEQ